MAPLLLLLLLLVSLLGPFAGVGAQDFDLSDALGDPTPPPEPPGRGGDDLDLSDALGGHDPAKPRPRDQPKPDPKKPAAEGGFSDSDLEGVAGPGGGKPRDGDQAAGEGNPQGLIPGVVGAVVAALAGAVSSFVAYQKKKLCFRERGSAPV